MRGLRALRMGVALIGMVGAMGIARADRAEPKVWEESGLMRPAEAARGEGSLKPWDPSEGWGLLIDCGARSQKLAEKVKRLIDRDRAPAEAWAIQKGADQSRWLRLKDESESTLELASRWGLSWESALIGEPGEKGGGVEIRAPSRAEIWLALMAKGRKTALSEGGCSVRALEEQVESRRMIAALAGAARWDFPDGEDARWGESSKWSHGDPSGSVSEALRDMFVNPESYAIGCYTATKAAFAAGMLLAPKRSRWSQRQMSLSVEGQADPLAQVEPEQPWLFIPGLERDPRGGGGRLAQARRAAPRNFIPGDWAYIWNRDEATWKDAGYEGSNMIYLGGGLFDDYYMEHRGAYTFEEKMEEAYQWRRGVYNKRDDAKRKRLDEAERRALEQSPWEPAGMLLPWRMEPRWIGWEPAAGPEASPSGKRQAPRIAALRSKTRAGG